MSYKFLPTLALAIFLSSNLLFLDAIAQPDIEVDVSSLELVLAPGEPHEETFNITNIGTETLNYQIDFSYVGEEAHVLLVDDDGSPNNAGSYTDIQRYYTDALDSAGIDYDFYVVDWTFTPEQPGPDAEFMSDYDLVIWFTGEAWGVYGNDTITPADEANLGQYLSGGGSLFLSSQDYFYVMYTGMSQFSPGTFPRDYLGVSTTQQDMWAPPSSCQGGEDSFARGLSYQCQVPYITETLWTDMVQGDGIPLLTVEGQPAALQYETDNFKAVFTALSFEGLLDGTSTKAEFMQSLVDWVESSFPGDVASQSQEMHGTMEASNTPTEARRTLDVANIRAQHLLQYPRELPIFDDTSVRHNRTPGQPGETDDPWLFLDPELGAVEPQESQLITASFEMPDTAEAGDFYEGTIIIENNSPTNPVVIPVMVYIEASVADESVLSPSDFALYQNYPNPFNPTTDIRFQIPFSQHVTLSIYDILGHNVATLINRHLDAGDHAVTFDGSILASGIYFCRLQTQNVSYTRKMILLK